ncbi:MAG TPA: HAMP domain-containing sensor histidine kinase [Noviherbaspirillum sp.]|nr:HAMP domain-containing sensor histidine kinase [Noviherbaspirillum sp.]
MTRSLRWRLAWTFTLLSTFAVLIQAVALFVGTEEREEELIDEVVNATLDEMLRRNPDSIPEEERLSPRLNLYHVEAGEKPSILPPHFSSVRAGNYEWYTDDGTEYHVGVRDYKGERLYLLYDTTEHEARINNLLWSLVLGLVVLSGVSLWLGYWLAGRMLYQLEKMTRRLLQDDTAILNEPDFDREVALLAGALDDYRQRNRDLLAREREFTANVSHELRTPLTGIRTSAELFTEDAALSGRNRERAERIIKSVDDMESRLRGLLFLGRELAAAERRPVDLKVLAEACADHFRPSCEAAGVTLAVNIAPRTMIDADPSLLQLLLENLIGNAVRYTTQGRIDVCFRDGELEIADTGIGIPPEHLAHVFQRHYRATDIPGGRGLGLSIVKRVCDVHGWRYRIDSIAAEGDARRGTRVTVAFGA